MSYTYPYISDAMANGLLSGIFSGVPTTLIGIATYVLSALGLYTIAKRRGLNHPWLAWIPVASAWIVGSLSDQYRYVVNGENKSKRKVLLTLNIITTVLSLVMVACGIGMVAQALIGAAGGIDPAAGCGPVGSGPAGHGRHPDHTAYPGLVPDAHHRHQRPQRGRGQNCRAGFRC